MDGARDYDHVKFDVEQWYTQVKYGGIGILASWHPGGVVCDVSEANGGLSNKILHLSSIDAKYVLEHVFEQHTISTMECTICSIHSKHSGDCDLYRSHVQCSVFSVQEEYEIYVLPIHHL